MSEAILYTFIIKGSAIDKYMDEYLIVAYALTDLPLQFRYNKNQKWDPLRAMKTFTRRKVGM